MRPPKNRVAASALLSLVLLSIALPSLPSRAAVVLRLALPELVLRAEHIVLAIAREKRSRFTPEGRIVTDVTLTVDQTLKGDFRPGQDIVVTRLGGEVGESAMLVEGAPRFQTGRSAVVFLRTVPSTGDLQVVGMSQGLFQVEEKQDRLFLVPGGSNLSLLHRDDGGRLVEAAEPAVDPAPVEDLLSEIRRLVAESRGR